MPFCPQCREEFTEGIEVCVDCDETPLVATLEGIPEIEEPAPGSEHIEDEARFVAEDRPLAEAITSQLIAKGVPAYLYEEPVLVEGREVVLMAVPAAFVEDTHAQLRSIAFEEVELDDGGTVRLYARPDSSEPTPAILELADDEILARGEAAHRDLLEVAVTGAPTFRARAVGLLHAAGPAGHAVLWAVVREAAEAGKADFVSDFLNWLRPIKLTPPDDDLDALLASAETSTRAIAIEVAGRLLGERAGAKLVTLLADEDADIRDQSIEMLFHIYGDDYGYEADADEADRARAIGRWRKRISG